MQCFSTFFDSRQPSFAIDLFGSTPSFNLPINRCQIHKLAAPLELFLALNGYAASRLRLKASLEIFTNYDLKWFEMEKKFLQCWTYHFIWAVYIWLKPWIGFILRSLQPSLNIIWNLWNSVSQLLCREAHIFRCAVKFIWALPLRQRHIRILKLKHLRTSSSKTAKTKN